jgi:hypothetical protein
LSGRFRRAVAADILPAVEPGIVPGGTSRRDYYELENACGKMPPIPAGRR